MGIFSDYAELYWELGYSIIPVNKNSKATYIDYSKYREHPCSEKELNTWIKKSPNSNIGIVTGKASGIAMIDLDIKNNPDLLSRALRIFPRSPVERFGSKGLGILIRYNGQSHRKLYYKDKEIGEIISNTQIVIPPSIHPDTKKAYKWTSYTALDSDTKENIISELPSPTDEEIDLCIRKLEAEEGVEVSEDFFKEKVGRNNRLKEIVGAFISMGYLPEKIAPLLLAEDFSLHRENPLFTDKTEFKQLASNPLACAYKFSSSIFRTYLNQATYKGDDIPQFSTKDVKEIQKKKEYVKYESFFIDKLNKSKKDKIDGVLKEKDWRGFWQPVGNKIKELKSYATDFSLKPDRIDIHYKRYEKELKSELLFEIPKWDGHDHIAEIMSYVTCENFTSEEMADFIKDWLSKIVNRVDTGDQNQMVILHGDQGVGKDIFIENLVGGFHPYFNNFTDTMQEKDIFMQIAKSMVINISEFDKLNKKHPGMIKDLISRRTAQFRPSHMPHFEEFRMNASFIGSSNALNFLTDPTGNRRFWIFNEVKINWSYPKNRKMQILAQAQELFLQKYKVSDENLSKMNAFVVTLSPESLDDFVAEYWNSFISKKLLLQEKLRFKDVEDTMFTISKLMGMRSVRPVQSIIKRLGGRGKDEAGAYYLNVNRKKELISEQRDSFKER